MGWYKRAQAGWQENWNDAFGDVQRYMYDAYSCQVTITKLAEKYLTVSASMSHAQFGNLMWQDFWKFELGDNKMARECFAQVREAVKKTYDEFESNDIPNNLLHSYLREAVRGVFPDNRPRTRIPSIDWSYQQKGVADWRQSIYGNRYPTGEIDGF